MALGRSLADDLDPESTQFHIPAEAGFLETLQVRCDAFEPEVGIVRWSGDDVAVVVRRERGAVVADESCCYLFGGDVGALGEGDCGAVGFNEGCGCFEGGCDCGHGESWRTVLWVQSHAFGSRWMCMIPSEIFYMLGKSWSFLHGDGSKGTPG